MWRDQLITLGRPDDTVPYVEKAAQLLEHWRGWRVDDLHTVERGLGVGPDVAGPDSLTPREREVVALLAEGLSNSELAARLYISPKTAAVHVSNILAKLGMSREKSPHLPPTNVPHRSSTLRR